MTYLIYPGATHRRFEHSLGVMELASRVFDIITNPENLTDEIRNLFPQTTDPLKKLHWKRILRIAALCHDIGHMPFSHAAEELLPDFPRGLILVTGPTGSGKSTTLATMIDYINEKRQEHIVTIEDPIEFIHTHKKCMINQRELHSDTSSFGKALKSVLRQDPDVVLVGELRDLETISLAITTAETGHREKWGLETLTCMALLSCKIHRAYSPKDDPELNFRNPLAPGTCIFKLSGKPVKHGFVCISACELNPDGKVL
jgi:hypothetical protein